MCIGFLLFLFLQTVCKPSGLERSDRRIRTPGVALKSPLRLIRAKDQEII